MDPGPNQIAISIHNLQEIQRTEKYGSGSEKLQWQETPQGKDWFLQKLNK